MAIHSSPSSSFSNDLTFDVFISFRGTDTRYGFTGNLYKALYDNGIRTFIDDKDLKRGDEITPSLLHNIENSRIAIIVFSENYATSSFCLDELVHIIHYFKTKRRLVLPVFYGVDPTHVRHQNESYGKALAEHEERFQNNMENMKRLQDWKMALTYAANLSGYHYNPGKEEYEYMYINKIVTEISKNINQVLLHVADYPVGLEPRMLKVASLLNVDCDNEVCLIGICGSGGLGKTTLTHAIYNLISTQFEGLCFLHNVRENSIKYGLEYLQEQLLSKSIGLKIKLGHVSEGIGIIKQRLQQKKVLLILDDVDKLKQLQVLVGEPSWLGPGSRVIVTTRDKNLLSCHGIKRIYELDALNEEEALELFKWMAFKSDKIDPCYDYILKRVVRYASGLPLALEVVGSSLFGKHIGEWEFALDKYERIPHEDIQKILKVSFDALDEEQQSVFLDIACCFKESRLAEVEEILHGHYGHCIKSHLQVLVDKSLIKISQRHWNYMDKVTLHDLIEDMGKEIVRQESPKEPGKRSRLWLHEDIVHVLKENTGTRKIEILHLNSCSTEAIVDWNEKAFTKMKNLKTLIIENVHFSKGERYLPTSLRVLKWNRCPLQSLSSSFWNKKFDNMRVLTFNNCKYLTDIPNVSCLPNLENFSFQKCHNLVTIHNSIGYLNKLEILNAKECIKIESFPPLRLTSLKKLELSLCKKLKTFPELLGKMTNIKEILLAGTSIKELPFSFQNLSELRELTIWETGMLWLSSNSFIMSRLSKITGEGSRLLFPKHNGKMRSIVFSNVEHLNIKNNNLSDECLPIMFTWFPNVKYLFLSGNNFTILPECLNECHSIRIFELDGCTALEEIRGIPPNLKKFYAIKCKSLISSSRRMLLSQKLHEAGCTEICLPIECDMSHMVPFWFEHQAQGQTISFWFRKRIPSIVVFYHPESFVLIKSGDNTALKVKLSVNNYQHTLPEDVLFVSHYHKMRFGHIFLFDLELEELVKRYHSYGKLMTKLDEALLKNEWIHAELKFESSSRFRSCQDVKIELSSRAEIGIHVLKEKRSREEDVIFTNPYRKRKSDEYLNPSLSQFHLPLEKHLVDMGISETQMLQQKRIALLSSMWNSVPTETKGKEHKG
ncbi:unnamed protein product [Lathyrus sativus]|nr:unnamed protein product [Lathyrus sativus]